MENILDIIAENERLIYSIIGKYKIFQTLLNDNIPRITEELEVL